jgi:tellurite resistance protein TehA-like permease
MRPPTAIERMPPAAFSFVMATAIVGTAFTSLGLVFVGVAAFALAALGFVVLLGALCVRVILSPKAVLHDARNPARAFGFFTLVAATGVTATLGSMLGAEWMLPGALAIAVVLWVLLIYGMLPWLITHTAGRALLPSVDGGWFLTVVATQSLSILGSATADGNRTVAFGALGLWCLGVVLYLLLISAVLVRMLTETQPRPDIAPTAWVITGATAISMLAATRVLTADIATRAEALGSIALTATALWSFGTFLIPVLLGLGVHELWSRPAARRFSVAWWSIVFPIGMYGTASLSFGRAVDVPELVVIGTIATWTGGLAWVLVAGRALLSATTALPRKTEAGVR